MLDVLFTLPRLRTLRAAALLELRTLSIDGAVRRPAFSGRRRSGAEPAALSTVLEWVEYGVGLGLAAAAAARRDTVDCVGYEPRA